VNVRWVDPGTRIGAQRGEVVVCIPVYGGHEHFLACLESVLAHTPTDVRILVCDDASPDPRSCEFIRGLDDGHGRELFYLRRSENVGFPGNANGGFELADPADVVIVNSDCLVAEGWLEGLRDAAYCDSRVATATTLTNHGSVVSLPDGRPVPGLPAGWSLDDAARVVRASSLRIRPRLPTAIGHCVYIRRSALELVGDFDLAFTPGYGEEVDFSQRCLQRGLSHVLADDVLVLHHGGASFATFSTNGSHDPVQHRHELLLAARYPYYHEAISELQASTTGPLTRARATARRAMQGLTVAVDARVLAGPMTGTQLHVLELIAALVRTGKARIVAVVPADLADYAARVLDGLPEVERRTAAQAALAQRADVAHRPFQVNAPEDLSFLASIGERVVITNQDLIGYHNPSYFPDFDRWEEYRLTTRAALAVADRVTFFSTHARDDALAEDLIEPARCTVVHIGVDHRAVGPSGAPSCPPGAAGLRDGAPAILCLGTDFHHKNRVFALRVVEALRRRHGWTGYLVLAGPSVACGSSRVEEAQVRASMPDLADAIVDVGAVSEAEKAWLFQRAHLVLYPTVQEGFGLVPFEAADHATPCMWAEGTSLNEVLPQDAAEIVAWNADETADRAVLLLGEQTARERNLAAIRGAAAKLTWDVTAQRLIDVYRETCEDPATAVSSLARRHGVMQGALTRDALRLIGPEGILPQELERPLLALATHPRISLPLFQAMRLGYRASYRVKRLRRRSAGADELPRQ
jgi:GT2 family glycosyltransferase/glycosyltransferase involved in cell wall biosynthesis